MNIKMQMKEQEGLKLIIFFVFLQMQMRVLNYYVFIYDKTMVGLKTQILSITANFLP